MTLQDNTTLAAEMAALGRAAHEAAGVLRNASAESKNRALLEAAKAIRANARAILAANKLDTDAARTGEISPAMLDRLRLTEERIGAMARGLEEIAALPDPVGRELARWTRPNGLNIARVATPIGVIGIIYESRPNVTADAGALCVKSGNVAILRGGSESSHSSRAIHAALPLAPAARFADLDGPTWLAVDVEPAIQVSAGKVVIAASAAG